MKIVHNDSQEAMTAKSHEQFEKQSTELVKKIIPILQGESVTVMAATLSSMIATSIHKFVTDKEDQDILFEASIEALKRSWRS